MASEHVEVEWDINALVSVSTWVHIAVAFDVSQAVATIAELYVDSVSQGNGTVISGTDCSSIIAGDTTHYIGSDGAGAAVDGQLFDWRLWLEDRATLDIATYYELVLTNSWNNALRQNLYKSGQSHINAAFNLSAVLFTENNGPIGFAQDTAAGGVVFGTGIGENYSSPAYTGIGGGVVYDDFLFSYSSVAFSGVPASVIELSGSTSAAAIVYRMRAYDSGLGRTVYWTTEAVDSIGENYTGPGPISDVVVSNVICQR